MKKLLNQAFLIFVLLISTKLSAQNFKWTKDGNGYFKQETEGIVRYSLPDRNKTVVVSKEKFIPAGGTTSLEIKDYFFSEDNKKLLIYTNAKKVWRQETRGDYWVLDLLTNKLTQVGKSKPASSLMFAKFSPDNKKVAYVSEHNIFVEDLATNSIKQLTQTNGTKKLINGTFDWVYEEEFSCLDGFRWSPDSKAIAYWQIDANKIRDFYMINTTDSIYSRIIPVEYPKVGESPSPCKIFVVDIATAKATLMNVPGLANENYIPRMEWAGNATELVLQQLNRKQNVSKLFYCNAKTGVAKEFYKEEDTAWVDVRNSWTFGDILGWDWLNNGTEFVWISEKDGWRHIYRLSRDGKNEMLLTKGNYDIKKILTLDKATNYAYFIASPTNATQAYLYRIQMDGKSVEELISPAEEKGTHDYIISPNGTYAEHKFSNSFTKRMTEIISLPDHKAVDEKESVLTKYLANTNPTKKVEFFQVTTKDGVTMDGWLVKPTNFDSTKKYPIVYHVYSEPASATVLDRWGTGKNRLYQGDMAADGYIYASLDGRGTPAPKGRAWRKAIYRKIGVVNIQDQAMGALAMFQKYNFIDTSRVAVWGWSGGGSATLNCMFQHPEIYKTGISIAAISNQLTYDNIYQERYMGIPQENREDFIKGSPLTYVKNFKGNLLYIHGTGDDNVHYQNAELLLNEMIKYNKQFQFMPYPNRTHSISEGEGTDLHLATLYTEYLKSHCPAGAK